MRSSFRTWVDLNLSLFMPSMCACRCVCARRPVCRCEEADRHPPPPPPRASTAAVPKVQAKHRFNAHPVLRQARACTRHTQQQSTVHDRHAGNSNVRHGRKSHQNKEHGVAMCATASPPCILQTLSVTISSHTRGNMPQVTVPSPPITMQRTYDKKQDMQTQGHKMSHELPVGVPVPRRNRLCVPLSGGSI